VVAHGADARPVEPVNFFSILSMDTTAALVASWSGRDLNLDVRAVDSPLTGKSCQAALGPLP
jgi:hypothetical protein